MAYDRTLKHFVSAFDLAPLWQSSTVYALNQLVVYNQRLYSCAIAHTAGGSFETDHAAGDWLEVSSGTTVWASGTYYELNQFVEQSDKLYQCLVAHTAGTFATDLSGGKWVGLLPGQTVPISLGGTGQTTQTAAFDALSPTTTKGDIIVSNGTNNVRQPIGASNGYVLAVDSTTSTGVVWSSPSVFGLPTTGGTMTGNITWTDGYGDLTQSGEIAGKLINIVLPVGTSTYTPTNGTRLIRVEMWGAGGGGASVTSTASTNACAGGGGGGGGYRQFFFKNISGLTGLYSIGTGGTTGSANTAGNAGGQTYFEMDGYRLICNSGNGGGVDTGQAYLGVAAGGSGGSVTASGTVSSKYVNIQNSSGYTGGDTAAMYFRDGANAGAVNFGIIGSGGHAINNPSVVLQMSRSSSSGGPATATAGCGGAGSFSIRNGTAASGVSGGSGKIIIYEYS